MADHLDNCMVPTLLRHDSEKLHGLHDQCRGCRCVDRSSDSQLRERLPSLAPPPPPPRPSAAAALPPPAPAPPLPPPRHTDQAAPRSATCRSAAGVRQRSGRCCCPRAGAAATLAAAAAALRLQGMHARCCLPLLKSAMAQMEAKCILKAYRMQSLRPAAAAALRTNQCGAEFRIRRLASSSSSCISHASIQYNVYLGTFLRCAFRIQQHDWIISRAEGLYALLPRVDYSLLSRLCRIWQVTGAPLALLLHAVVLRRFRVQILQFKSANQCQRCRLTQLSVLHPC